MTARQRPLRPTATTTALPAPAQRQRRARRLDDPYADPPTVAGVLCGLLMVAVMAVLLALLWLHAGAAGVILMGGVP